MRPSLIALLAALLCSCAGPSAPESKAANPSSSVAAPPPDESRRFPQAGLAKMELVPGHLLDQKFMPAGNLATYNTAGVTYQLFLGSKDTPETAAFLLLDWKKTLEQPDYLANMGGYFGTANGRQIYVFTKRAWVAGVVGLPERKADVIARQFAARL